MTIFAIHDPKAIASLLQEGGLAEVFLDEEHAPYTAWLIGTDLPDGEPGLRLAPLEPAVGNIRIRHTHRVRIRLFQHDASLEGWCRFLGHGRLEGKPCVMLTQPATLIESFVRHEARLDLSRHPMAAQVLPAGWGHVLDVMVDDLSAEGLALTTSDEAADLPEASHVSISLPLAGERDLLLEGTVQSRHVLRRPDDPYRVLKRYGVHFDFYRLDREHLRRFRQLLASLNQDETRGAA